MKYLLNCLSICCILSISHISQAQTLNNFSLKDIGQSVILTMDGNGKMVNLGVDMENYGSPYFDPEFLPANIVLANGQRYENVLIKINLLIEQFPRLFLYDQSMSLKKAPKSNEDLISLYKVDAIRLKDILEKNNLKIKKEEDFIKCISKLNEN